MLLAIVLSIPFGGVAFAGSPAGGPIVITTEERWEEVDRTVTRQIEVLEGGSLTIVNATVDLRIDQTCTPGQINGMYCHPHVDVREGGSLVVENSSLTSSFEDHTDRPSIIASGGSITIEDSQLSQLASLRVEFDGHLSFRGNDVDAAGEVGIWRGSTGTIAGSTFGPNSSGVGVQDASPVVHNNTFEQISGFSVRIQQSVVGDKTYTTAPRVVDNVFVSPGQGIFTDAGAGVEIAHNRFEDAEFHAVSVRIPTHDGAFTMLDTQPPSIEANVFQDNHRAVEVFTVPRRTTTVASQITITGNVIEGSVCDHIEADGAPHAPLVVDARDNWWGSDEGPPEPEDAADPSCQALDGTATFEIEPWLEQAPQDAGPRTSA